MSEGKFRLIVRKEGDACEGNSAFYLGSRMSCLGEHSALYLGKRVLRVREHSAFYLGRRVLRVMEHSEFYLGRRRWCVRGQSVLQSAL